MTRETILKNIRNHLRRGSVTSEEAAVLKQRLSEHRRGIVPARIQGTPAELVELFIQQAEK